MHHNSHYSHTSQTIFPKKKLVLNEQYKKETCNMLHYGTCIFKLMKYLYFMLQKQLLLSCTFIERGVLQKSMQLLTSHLYKYLRL